MKTSQQPMFIIGSNGIPEIEFQWRKPISEVLSAMGAALGEGATIYVWPYRVGAISYVAVDSTGPRGDMTITVIESGTNKLPSLASIHETRECQWEMVDLVDAFYLIEALHKSIESSSVSFGCL